MIIIYYSDKKLPKRLHFLEADMISIKKTNKKNPEDVRSLAQKRIFEVISKDTFIKAHVPNDRRCASDILKADE